MMLSFSQSLARRHRPSFAIVSRGLVAVQAQARALFLLGKQQQQQQQQQRPLTTTRTRTTAAAAAATSSSRSTTRAAASVGTPSAAVAASTITGGVEQRRPLHVASTRAASSSWQQQPVQLTSLQTPSSSSCSSCKSSDHNHNDHFFFHNELKVSFSDGTSHCFSAAWLRDACRCPDCFPLTISNRAIRNYEQEAEVAAAPFQAKIIPAANSGRSSTTTTNHLSLTWSKDGHVTEFPAPWLRVWADVQQQQQQPPQCSSGRRYDASQRIPWSSELEIPVFHVEDLLKDTTTAIVDEKEDNPVTPLETFLMTLYHDPGVAILKGMHTAPSGQGMQSGLYDFVTHSIGPVHQVHNPNVWEIATTTTTTTNTMLQQDQSMDYSRRPLNKHTDHPHYNTRPPLGWFMQVASSSGRGASGSSGTAVTDSLRCWNQLTRQEQHVLQHSHAIFGNRRTFGVTAKDSACVVPLVQLLDTGTDDDGRQQLDFVRHSTSKLGPRFVSSSSSSYYYPVEEQLRVWRKWNDIIQDQSHEVVAYLEQGDALCLNNHRVLHGRALVTGDRVVQGCYVSEAVLENRLRLLIQDRLPSPSCDDLALMLPTSNVVAFGYKTFGWEERTGTNSGSNQDSNKDNAPNTATNSISHIETQGGKTLTTTSKVQLEKGGTALDLEFDDGAQYQFSAAWLTDSLPEQFGTDSMREHEGLQVEAVLQAAMASAVVNETGTHVTLEFVPFSSEDEETNNTDRRETVPAVWLRAVAPLVATPLNDTARSEARTLQQTVAVRGPDACSGFGLAERNAKPWVPSTLEIPVFEYDALMMDNNNKDRLREDMLLAIADPGVVKIVGAPCPEGVDGKVLTQIVTDLVGKPVQHPSRANCIWNIRTELGQRGIGSSDYALDNPLAMHTDQSFRYETSFLIWMHQTRGYADGMIADGLAINEHLRTHDRRTWEILTSTPVTFGYRHRLCGPDGELLQLGADGFQLLEHERHVHWPAIMCHPDGSLRQIRVGESKRSVQNLPPGQFEEWYEAYNKFLRLTQSEDFVRLFNVDEGEMVVINNHRLIHGRARIKSEFRTLLGTYNGEEQVRTKHRLLMMRRLTEQHGLDEKWLMRLPTPALANMERLS